MEHYRLEHVADGVVAALHRPGGGGVGNAAIVRTGDSTIVFDTGMTPQAGAELRRTAVEIAPVSFVVNSHWHDDHVRGNQAFSDVQIVATGRTKELIETRAAERLAEQRAIEPDEHLASLPEGPDKETARYLAVTIADVRLTPPTTTFEERLELAPGCELVTLGGGHTESDAFLVLPDRGVAVLGDLLFNRIHPWMGDGDPRRWIEILDAVADLGATRFVPGHGAVAGLEDVRALRDHLRSFLDDPEGLAERYPDWEFDGMLERNRAALQRTADTAAGGGGGI